jgi:TatD DNase family protein
MVFFLSFYDKIYLLLEKGRRIMIDTHAHLTEKVLYEDLDNIIKKAKEFGVNDIISVGMTNIHNIRAIKIAEKYENVYATVGIHPNEATREKLDLNLLREQANHKKVIAIGEIGIDLYRNKETLEIQKKYFIKQIKLAMELDLPIIVHSRNSAEVIYDILKDYKGVKGVMHCYSEHPELVSKFIDLGFYISVGGIVTFKSAEVVRDIAKMIPIDRLLIETDAPYLAPMPYRGKRNEPAYVKYTMLKLAEVKNINEKELVNIMRENTYRLFSKMKRKS